METCKSAWPIRWGEDEDRHLLHYVQLLHIGKMLNGGYHQNLSAIKDLDEL